MINSFWFKRSSLHLIATLALSLFLSACGGDGDSSSGGGSEIKPEESKTERTILVLGDSISNGYTTSANYPEILGRKTGFAIVNRSITGGQAETVIAPIRSLLDRYNPKYVIILLGTNNALSGNPQSGVSAIAFAVRVSIEKGAIPLIGTLPHIFTNSYAERQSANISSQISGISGARTVEVRNIISRVSLTTDGIHPNVEGQNAIANAFARFIN